MARDFPCVCWYRSPLGRMRLAASGGHALGLWFEGSRHFPADALSGFAEAPDHPVLVALGAWLDAYFAGKTKVQPDIPLKMNGSHFQLAVWEGLARIPYGKTMSYASLASLVGYSGDAARRHARAVGAAVGRNPFSVLLPCHRVIGSNGQITGYAGGVEKKLALLELEKRSMA